MNDLSTLQVVAAALIGIVSVARTARLLVWDEYPPTMWLRRQWDNRIGEVGWGKLLHCQFCLTPWLSAVLFAWFWIAESSDGVWDNVWWIANGVWAGSYIAASWVSYDQPEG